MRRLAQREEQQIATIEQFQRRGELHKLAFAVEMHLPRKHRGTDGKRYAAATMPTGEIPYIPMVEAWFVSMALAEELASLFARDNAGAGIDFYPALCTLDTEGLRPYADVSADVDTICMECGMIIPISHQDKPDTDHYCCPVCLDKIAKKL